MKSNEEQERRAFEDFMADRFHNSVDRRRAKNGDQGYMSWDMIVAWAAWQARAKQESNDGNG